MSGGGVGVGRIFSARHGVQFRAIRIIYTRNFVRNMEMARELSFYNLIKINNCDEIIQNFSLVFRLCIEYRSRSQSTPSILTGI